MTIRSLIVFTACLFAAVPFIQAQELDTESIEHPLGRGAPGLALIVGGAIQHTSHGTDVGPVVAARYYFPKSDSETGGPESLSSWAVELGAILPHTLPGSVDDTSSGPLVHAKVRRFGSEHLAVQYRWAIRRPLRMTPELSLGVSVAQFETEYYTFVQQGTILTQPMGTAKKSAWGPWVRLGLPLLANDWFAFRMEVGYSHYSNKVDAFGHRYDLGVSGLGVYPTIQIGLGYLQPGIEKGAYLPPSAMPLWVIGALQTEKKSPVIAPPEVLLNARATSVQGGLSGNVLFQYKNRGAQKVELAGDFNQWKPEPLYMDKAHVWLAVKDLPAGHYQYV